MSFRRSLARARYKYVPDHVLGELLSKNWVDNAIPVLILVLTLSLIHI